MHMCQTASAQATSHWSWAHTYTGMCRELGRLANLFKHSSKPRQPCCSRVRSKGGSEGALSFGKGAAQTVQATTEQPHTTKRLARQPHSLHSTRMLACRPHHTALGCILSLDRAWQAARLLCSPRDTVAPCSQCKERGDCTTTAHRRVARTRAKTGRNKDPDA
jgi:hypothetical protein